eukprot:30520-Eustigmatos_ZCMA.PRE.1
MSEPVQCSKRFKVPKVKTPDERLRILVEDDWRTIPDLIAKTVSTTQSPVIHFFVPTRSEVGKGTKTVRH